jgi:flagellar biosynthesis chaperone FliJ
MGEFAIKGRGEQKTPPTAMATLNKLVSEHDDVQHKLGTLEARRDDVWGRMRPAYRPRTGKDDPALANQFAQLNAEIAQLQGREQELSKQVETAKAPIRAEVDTLRKNVQTLFQREAAASKPPEKAALRKQAVEAANKAAQLAEHAKLDLPPWYAPWETLRTVGKPETWR